MVSIRENLLSSAKYDLKVPVESCAKDMKYIVVHDTANDASAANEVAYMIRNDSSTSFNAAVDDKEIVVGIPLDKGWARFLKMIESEMKDDKKETKTDAKPVPKQLYRVRTSWSDAKSQIGAYAMLENAKNACPVGYKVYASNGKIVYEPFKAYTVRKDAADALNIRKGPGTNYDVQGQITDTKRYTVVEESAGVGSAKGWGRLKAGGWVALDWVKKA